MREILQKQEGRDHAMMALFKFYMLKQAVQASSYSSWLYLNAKCFQWMQIKGLMQKKSDPHKGCW